MGSRVQNVVMQERRYKEEAEGGARISTPATFSIFSITYMGLAWGKSALNVPRLLQPPRRGVALAVW